jgi:hypothetical protein
MISLLGILQANYFTLGGAMNEIYRIITTIGFDDAIMFFMECQGEELYFKKNVEGRLLEISKIIGREKFHKLHSLYLGNKIYIRKNYAIKITHLQIINDYEYKRMKVGELCRKYNKTFQTIRNIIKEYQHSDEKDVIKGAIQEMELSS